MTILARVLLFGLLALCYGIGNCAVVPNTQDFIKGSSHQVKPTSVTTIDTASEDVVLVVVPYRNLSTFVTIQQHPSHQVRTTQDANPVTLVSNSYSPRPTRAGENTSRPPRASHSPSFIHSPIMTEIPAKYSATHLGSGNPQDKNPRRRNLDKLEIESKPLWLQSDDAELARRDDYDDGYGYAYGSTTASAINGGYGNSPGPTNLPAGGYGNPLPPAANKPNVVTMTDPATVTVSLALQTPSSAVKSSSTVNPPVIVVIQTATSASVPQVPVHNATQTVPESDPVSPSSSSVTAVITWTSTQQFTTFPLSAGTTPEADPYVYTTVTPASSASHTGPSLNNVIHTPTGHPSPRPITETSAAGSTVELNRHLLFVVAALAAMGPLLVSLVGGPLY